MQDNDAINCVGDCNFEMVRETHLGDDGHPITERVERCTRCGYVVEREILPPPQPNG